MKWQFAEEAYNPNGGPHPPQILQLAACLYACEKYYYRIYRTSEKRWSLYVKFGRVQTPPWWMYTVIEYLKQREQYELPNFVQHKSKKRTKKSA